MTDMDRRDFLLASVVGSATLLGFNDSPVSRVLERLRASTAQQVVVRKNIYCLTASSPDIVAYRSAINTMRSRPATDPTSWLAQANIHGSFSPPPGMITDACEHFNLFFLSWHRIYLYYFERIVRAASGTPTFALPYWGYTPVGSTQRNIPAMFRDPAGIPELYVAQRNSALNSGTQMTASIVDSGAAMADLTFSPFSSDLEGTPHGDVHVAVGSLPTTAGPGVDGWMGAFETAGQDPIFWLHHANLDRLWSAWIASGGGRANPTTATWLNHSWTFYDETGAQVTMTGAQVLDTAAQLGYSYARTSCVRRPPLDIYTRIRLIDPRILELLKRIRIRKPWPGPPPPPLAQGNPVALKSSPLNMRLPVSPEGRRILERFPTQRGEGNNVALVFSDIRLQSAPTVFYEVYVNLPRLDARTEYTSPHYVGNISFFGPSPRGRHKEMPLTRSLSLLTAYARLSAAGLWRNDTLQVTLVPRAFAEGGQPERLLAGKTQATIGRIELRIE